jgi:hypothetical protein
MQVLPQVWVTPARLVFSRPRKTCKDYPSVRQRSALRVAKISRFLTYNKELAGTMSSKKDRFHVRRCDPCASHFFCAQTTPVPPSNRITSVLRQLRFCLQVHQQLVEPAIFDHLAMRGVESESYVLAINFDARFREKNTW